MTPLSQDEVSRLRSHIMRSVHSTGNKTTELKIIQIFKSYRIKGWRRKYKLVGKPDFAFPNNKVALFVDGCFWHGHRCRNTVPVTNKEFWAEKQHRNTLRDKIVNRCLHLKNWTVVRFWECELNSQSKYSKKIRRLEIKLTNCKTN